jgi:Na+/H+ antiporter NhaD/arsenite permease-like protein
MAVIAGFSSIGVFRILAEKLLAKVTSLRALEITLVFLCFFSSMFITNDVALITFVPFTILILSMADMMDSCIFLVVMETISANLGSMLTPLGNPHNLYLYTEYKINITDFLLMMLPYTIVSFVFLTILLFLRKNKALSLNQSAVAANDTITSDTGRISKKSRFVLYLILFVLCLLVVLHILTYQVLLILVLAGFLIADRSILREVDYALLLTFVCFFIFIGNLKNIPQIHSLLGLLIQGHEFIVGILSSQFISNVPAAILLAGFTSNYKALLIGVNVGGLGTLIASMASLISYKIYIKAKGSQHGKYMRVFTQYNLLFLAVLIAFYLIFWT